MENSDTKLIFDAVKLTADYINQFTQQLITLAVGVLALSITFTKDIVKDSSFHRIWLLKASWVVFLISIVCGLLVMSNLTEVLVTRNSLVNDISPAHFIEDTLLKTKFYSSSQFAVFLFGCILLIIYGAFPIQKRVPRKRKTAETPVKDL
jgi:hypothetical protein